MANVPTLWSGGAEWATAETEGATAYWVDTLTGTGRPELFVAIDGKLGRAQLQSGSWTTGRTDWTSTLSPGGASFSFVGTLDAAPNDLIVVSCDLGALWVGRVDTVTTNQTIDGFYWSSVTCTDIIGILGQAQLKAESVAAGTLKTITETLATVAGLSITVTDASTSGLPTLLADASYDGSVLSYINRAELSSNALLFLMPDGTLRAVIREASDESEITTISLTGDNSPSSWTETLSVVNNINRWTLTKEDGTVVLDTSHADDIALYGERAFSVDGYLSSVSTHFTDWVAAASGPRPLVTNAEFPITDYNQDVLMLAPLDWVERNETVWQVMSVSHTVDLSSWRVTITADSTQNSLVDVVDPEPVDPDPEITTDTQSNIVSLQDTTTYLSSGGTKAGNGQGDYLPVGYWLGTRTRVHIRFPITWPSGVISVKKATLKLRTGDQAWVGYGSNPKFYVRRNTESWSEGTFNGAAPNQYSTTNATVWPGPSRTTYSQVLKTCSRTENNDITIDITDIANAWLSTGTNYGLSLISANEDSSNNTIEFYAEDDSNSYGPRLDLVCYVA